MSRSASNEYEGARAMSKTKAYDELSDEAVNELEAALEADLNSRSDRLPDSDETSEDSKDAKASFDETSHPASTEVDFSFEDFERQLSETADEFRADDADDDAAPASPESRAASAGDFVSKRPSAPSARL